MATQEGFTVEEKEFLERFEHDARLADERQSIELMGCTNKYQFAKTYKVYKSDWQKTRSQVLSKGSKGGLRREVVEAMAAIGDDILKDKLEILAIHFKNTWNEPITNYVGREDSVESLHKMMERNGEKTEMQEVQFSRSSINWPLILTLLAFFILVVLPAVLHQL